MVRAKNTSSPLNTFPFKTADNQKNCLTLAVRPRGAGLLPISG